MISILWAKVWKYVAGLGVLLAAIAAIFLKGKSTGEAKQQAKVDQAQQKADIAIQQKDITESRHDTDTTVQNLPEAPAQMVATSQPGTAAGELRDDGWTRD